MSRHRPQMSWPRTASAAHRPHTSGAENRLRRLTQGATMRRCLELLDTERRDVQNEGVDGGDEQTNGPASESGRARVGV